MRITCYIKKNNYICRVMKHIYNNIIPFKGYKAINLFGVLFIRKGSVMRWNDINHEDIHTAQMKEMLYVFFYIWYVIEWTLRYFACFSWRSAYRAISFEKEAYKNQNDVSYLTNRKHYSWFKLI